MKNRNSWLDTVNPIRGLSVSQAKSIFDCARKHGSALLQKIYDEIENTDPTLMTCVDRRAAAISGIGWQVVARASAKNQNLADQQRLAVDGFLSGIENFDEALEHLDLAFFRGFSHCQPIWEADGTVKRINLLNSWNFLRDKNGEWYFNPEASSDLTGCEKILPEARLMTLSRRRAIDWPALVIYIRKSLGEQDWGRYVERYGLPNFIATMHQGADEKQRDEYLKAARAIRDAQPAAIPSGGTVTTVGTESRGQDPFSNFIEHQEKLIVLMATGGTLTSLAQADTGSLAGGAQMDVWREIVRRDVAAISAVVNRALVRPFIEQKFPGAEIACEFKIEASEKPGKKETAELAATLKNAGYTINQSELEEAVGFSLEKSETQPAPSTPFLNKETPDKKKPGNALATALQDAFEAAIGEAMAEELEGKTAANKKDAQGNEHDEGNGQFASQGGSSAMSDKAKAKAEKVERQAKNKEHGIAGMSVVENGEDCLNFMTSQKLGRIAFYQANYRHIANNADGNHAEMLKDDNIPNTLAYGKYYPDTYKGVSGWAVMNGNKFVFLSKDGDGVRIDSAYISETKAAVFKRRTAIENKEV